MNSKSADIEINSVLSTKTEVNDSLVGERTTINSEVQAEHPNFTEVNPQAQNFTVSIPAGTILLDKYVVDIPLSTNTGEAVLYLCKYKNETYVAKVYRRQAAIKDDVILALESVNSPNIAKLYDTGIWNGAPFEIIPYYKYGSLEGKTFSFERLKNEIIPDLSNGLKALHQKNIIHKDLKPSNIMLCDDQKQIAIIDFGISSIREGGNTVVVTKTGMTPEYSAPETFRNLFLEESDYYSLGITIYELFCGHTPYAGIDKDTIEQYIAVQKIPFSNNFPIALEKLISGLTYNDITNRKDKSNPNRRWTYEEVKRWCTGEDVPVPGINASATSSKLAKISPFTFQYKRYTKIGDLANALGSDWENGKRRLYRSLLTEYFKPVDQEIATRCMDAEEAVRKDRNKADIEFFKLLYFMYPQMKAFHWQNFHYPDMFSLGSALLQGLLENNKDMENAVNLFIENHLFSEREMIVSHNDYNRGRQLAAIEGKYLLAQQKKDIPGQLEQLYILGFFYSGSKDLVIKQGTFSTVASLVNIVKHAMKESPEKVDEISKELILPKKGAAETFVENNRSTPQFTGWLFAHGKISIIQ